MRTTGPPPLALLLDNRESNDTDDVDATLGDETMKIRATIGRAQTHATHGTRRPLSAISNW